jgi:hypothetical protein
MCYFSSIPHAPKTPQNRHGRFHPHEVPMTRPPRPGSGAGRRRSTPCIDGLESRRLPAVTIQLNYQFDTAGFFSNPAARALMQQAADTDAADLGDTLQAINPSGQDTWTASFSDGTTGINESIANLVVPASTLIVYVFGASLPSGGEAGVGMTGGFQAQGDQAWLDTVQTRGKPATQYSTWGGAIAFDDSQTPWFFGTDASQMAPSQTDFLTVAEHEIGHVLGIGTSTQWQNLVSNGQFIGPAAEAAYGAPVPVDEPGQGHWAEGTMSDGHPATMDPVLLDGTRDVFTTLDDAALKDIGWDFQAPVVQFAQTNPAAAQNAGGVTITVNRTGGNGPATVNYATTAGTATAGVDYTPVAGTLFFPIGTNSQSFTVPLLDNPNLAAPVTVGLALSDPTAGATVGAASTATLTINPVSTTPAPSAPVLNAQDIATVHNGIDVTAHNGATAALHVTVSGVAPAGGYVRLYANGNLVTGPIWPSGGSASFVLSGNALADGLYRFTATAAPASTGPASAASAPTMVEIDTHLQIQTITPNSDYVDTSTFPGKIVLVFNHALAGLTADQPDNAGFAGHAFSVMLIPSGPDGGALYAAHAASLWTAPSGVDSGDLPVPAQLVYHENPDGTSQIALTPAFPLSTDIYLVSVSGLTDLAGNALAGSGGPGTSFYTSFDLHASPADNTPLQVTGVSADQGKVVIAGNSVPQPDTIGIAFNKALDTWTVNTGTIHLYDQAGAPQPAAVAYSPATHTAYLTPETVLTPGTVYFVAVDPSVSDDQSFPNPGGALGHEFATSFTVSGPAVSGSAPLTLLRTAPADSTQDFQALGYGAATFSEAVNRAALGRFSAMLIPQTGGANTGGSGYADVPLNAKVAFNPNTDQLIIVPTQPVGNSVFLFSLSGITAADGDTLAGTAYATFQLVTNGTGSARSLSAPLRVVTPPTATPRGPAAVHAAARPVRAAPTPPRRVVPQRRFERS